MLPAETSSQESSFSQYNDGLNLLSRLTRPRRLSNVDNREEEETIGAFTKEVANFVSNYISLYRII